MRHRQLTHNKLKVLSTVRHSPGICKADIARATDLDSNTVSKSVHELRARGLVYFMDNKIGVTRAGISLCEDYVMQGIEKIRGYCVS